MKPWVETFLKVRISYICCRFPLEGPLADCCGYSVTQRLFLFLCEATQYSYAHTINERATSMCSRQWIHWFSQGFLLSLNPGYLEMESQCAMWKPLWCRIPVLVFI
ncbi:uncharacterized protein LOC130770034 isoform X1 [Actinidia eriantha]|uniref:uncharacterized protein LOC130770034 isoform X1 n=1 Tax=Actinidia eriantha TaxID=165200 RepID=UPI0025856C6C|nr:uncharacterized protein LOC130770034 isoform X1 [Actinidia eriantha]